MIRIAVLLPLIGLLLLACKPHSTKTKPEDIEPSEAEIPINQTSVDDPLSAWEKQNDSIRTALLTAKENDLLKESFFQEFYLRDAIEALGDSLYFNIRFDLHGLDCGTPDCYGTDLSFYMKLGDFIEFPKNLYVLADENGCLDKENLKMGEFQLIDHTQEYVIYHCPKLRNSLVLFSQRKESQGQAFYLEDADASTVNSTNVSTLFREFSSEDEDSLSPYMSWILETNDYVNFL